MQFKLNDDLLYFFLNYGYVHEAMADDKYAGYKGTFDDLHNYKAYGENITGNNTCLIFL
jgi:hypothetical protein